MKIKKIITAAIFLLVLCAGFISFTHITKAASLSPYSGIGGSQSSSTNGVSACNTSGFFGMPTWYEYLPPPIPPDCEIKINPNQISSGAKYDWKEIWLIGFAILDMLLIVAGVLAVMYVIIGGFKFVTAQGAPDKIANARNTIYNALIGAVIAIIASQTVNYIANQFKVLILGPGAYGLPDTSASANTLKVVINIALVLLGAISVLVITISGLQIVISAGDSQKVAKARQAILYAVIGVVVAIFAATIVNFVLGKVI